MYADIPKMAVQQLVSIAVSHQMRIFVIVDHMDIDPDSKTLRVGTSKVRRRGSFHEGEALHGRCG